MDFLVLERGDSTLLQKFGNRPAVYMSNIPEDLTLYQHCFDNLKVCIAHGNVWVLWRESHDFLLNAVMNLGVS